MQEIYKSIKGYEDYQVSNLGNVKSFKKGNERVLKPALTGGGYLGVNLYVNSKQQTRTIHQLVAETFLGFKRCKNILVVNHKDFNRLNNKLDNLEVVTHRENSNQKHIQSSSNYTGVSLHKQSNFFVSQIQVNGTTKRLGFFKSELEASIYYENALNAIKNGLEIVVKKRNFTSKYKGVFFDKNKNKWISKITINKKQIVLGRFNTEIEAFNAYENEFNKPTKSVKS